MIVPAAVEDLLRELAPRVVGALTRRYGDFAAAEDATQEALLAAAAHWSRDGVPDAPLGWLVTTAGRRLVDQARADRSRSARETLTAARETPAGAVPGRDDTLVLLFLCCHPALTPASAIALTLRAVGGLTTAEIARAFLVPEATMAQRISRAKQRIRSSGVPFGLPGPDERDARLRSVLHVLYLLFNEGYAASAGEEPYRAELTAEAIRLARLLHAAVPADAEATGLLALLLLLDARRPARLGAGGRLVPLPEQDRTRWDADLIAEGTALLDAALARRAVGDYQLQAAIASLHDHAPRAADTDWVQIAGLYDLLERMTGNPLVRLSRVVAVAMAHGPEPARALLATVEERLAGSSRLDAVRGHLHELAGERAAAAAAYARAAERATNLAERHHLAREAARLR